MDTCICVIIGIIVIVAIAFLLYKCCCCGSSRRVFGGGEEEEDENDSEPKPSTARLIWPGVTDPALPPRTNLRRSDATTFDKPKAFGPISNGIASTKAEDPNEFIPPKRYSHMPPDPEEYWPPLTRRQRDLLATIESVRKHIRTTYPMVTKENIDMIYGPWREDDLWSPLDDPETTARVSYVMPVPISKGRSPAIDTRAYYWREYAIAHLIVYDPAVCDIVREIVRLPADEMVFADDYISALIDHELWPARLHYAMDDFYNSDPHFLERRLSDYDERQRQRQETVLVPKNIFMSDPNSLSSALAQLYITDLVERPHIDVIEPTTAYGRVAYFLYRLMRAADMEIFNILDDFLPGLGLDENRRPRIDVYRRLVRTILSLTAAFDNYEILVNMISPRVRNPDGTYDAYFKILAERYYIGVRVGENRIHFFSQPLFKALKRAAIRATNPGSSNDTKSNEKDDAKEEAMKEENDKKE